MHERCLFIGRGREPERSQRVNDDSHIDQLLQERALNGHEIAKRRSDHASRGQTNACNDALQSDLPGSASDLEPW